MDEANTSGEPGEEGPYVIPTGTSFVDTQHEFLMRDNMRRLNEMAKVGIAVQPNVMQQLQWLALANYATREDPAGQAAVDNVFQQLLKEKLDETDAEVKELIERQAQARREAMFGVSNGHRPVPPPNGRYTPPKG